MTQWLLNYGIGLSVTVLIGTITKTSKIKFSSHKNPNSLTLKPCYLLILYLSFQIAQNCINLVYSPRNNNSEKLLRWINFGALITQLSG